MSFLLRRAWQTGRTTAPPPGAPTPTQFGSHVIGGVSTNATSIAVTFPASIPAGALILAYAAWTRGNATVPTLGMSGFSQLAFDHDVSASIGSAIVVFGKIAAGGDGSVNLTATNGGNMQWVTEVWTGHGGMPATVPATVYTAGTGSYNSNQVAVSESNSIVSTFLGGRGPNNGDIAPVWGGGATGYGFGDSGRVPYAKLAGQTVATPGNIQHTVSVTNTQGGATTGLVSLVIEPA